MDLWWLNWNTVGALIACVAVVAIPLYIRRNLQKKSDADNINRLSSADQCVNCGSASLPLGYLDFIGYEGYFLNAWKQYHISSVLCTRCAESVCVASRKRILRTFWRCCQDPMAIILTFWNTRRALAKHKESIGLSTSNGST